LKSSISEQNIEQVNHLSKEVNIEWFCTPMYDEAVDLLNPFVNKFKIRNFDGLELLKNNKTSLIEKILKTEKEIIVSSNENPEKSDFYKNDKIKWLYVVPKYPCKFEDLNFENLNKFNGYSNHCPHFLAPLTAAILGAEIIEIHVTSDKSGNFIDNPVSLDFNEVKLLVGLIKKSLLIKK